MYFHILRQSRFWLLTAAIFASTLLSFQYPLTSTFPIGGDAAPFVSMLTAIQTSLPEHPGLFVSLLRQSTYPLTHLIFLSTALLPIDWPHRYIVAMSLAQLASTAALGFFSYRVAGWRTAALAMFAWNLTIIGLNNHFEDGTIAQLFSLVGLLLFLERLWAGSQYGALLLFGAIFLLHPLTALLVLSAILLSTPAWALLRPAFSSSEKRIAAVLLAAALLVLVPSLWLIYKGSALSTLAPDGRHLQILNVIHSPFGFFVLLSPAGFGLFVRAVKTRSHLLAGSFLLILTCLAGLLAFNNLLGVAIWTFRFQTYLYLLASFYGALALSHASRILFPRPFLQTTFLILFISALTIGTWHANALIYANYESPSRYLRLQPEEREGMVWLNDNTPAASYVYTTTSSRHAEWIPIFSHNLWRSINLQNTYSKHQATFPLISDDTDTKELSNHYLFIFHHDESVPDIIARYPDAFPRLYHNKAVSIYYLAQQLP